MPAGNFARDSKRTVSYTAGMRLALWAIAAILIVLVFSGEKVRRYFGLNVDAPPSVTQDATLDSSKRVESPSDNAQSTGAYVPSPADDPNLHNSPTRRLGF
jgi:hypothetical protein